MLLRRSVLIGAALTALSRGASANEPVELDLQSPYARAAQVRVAQVGLIYPKFARDAGEQGRVTIGIVIGRKGELLDSRVVRSSGSQALDDAALTAIRRATFAPIPQDLAADRVKILMPFEFRL
jgi:protein TonB